MKTKTRRGHAWAMGKIIKGTLAAVAGEGIRPDMVQYNISDRLGREVCAVIVVTGTETVAHMTKAASVVAARIDWNGRKCRFCGCTEDCACPGGCSWIAPRVCSACAELWERETERKAEKRKARSGKG